jgi:LL-diaminopimelate aminotransferase
VNNMEFSADRMQVFPAHFFAGLNARVARLKAEGKQVIRLDVGSPDLPPAEHILQALKHSADQPGSHGYQPHHGPPALRQAWVDMYQRLYQVDLDLELEVLPLMGSKEGIFNLGMAMVNQDDVVLIPDPGYLTYNAATLFAGGKPAYLPLTEEGNFLPELEATPRRILEKAKMMWLNYPNNPTAGVADPDFFNRVVSLAHDHGLLVCHDAAYAQVTFEGYQAPSILQVPGAKEVAVEFNTLSKSHNMAGWRSGVVVGNGEVISLLRSLKTNIDSGQFLPVMEAASAALNGDQAWLIDRNRVYQRRRDIVIDYLGQMGLTPRVPQASLYVWCPIPDGWTARTFAIMLLERAQVSLTPGDIFGAHGEGYVRISLTVPEEMIEVAMQRVKDVLINAGG